MGRSERPLFYLYELDVNGQAIFTYTVKKEGYKEIPTYALDFCNRLEIREECVKLYD